jgi:hypothetical protein
MTQLQRAIQREMDDFINRIQEPGASLKRVSSAAFTKARAKLKHTAFVELGEIILKIFYSSSPFKKDWKGYRLISADGSTCEVPNSDELIKEFGVHTVRPDGKVISLARVCQLYDVKNNLALSAKISPFIVSESAMVWKMLKENKFGTGDLFIFDRYFYSSLYALYFHTIGADFCFRVKKNLGIVKSMGKKKDILVEISLTKEYAQEASRLGITADSMKCRLIKIRLESGETEYLLSSLIDKEGITFEDIKELYSLRWGIEEHYKKMKHKVCIENFSGKTLESVYQDYYAKIFIVNLTSTLIHPVDEVLREEPKEKYFHKVNFISALGKLKYTVIDLFMKETARKAISIIHQWFLNTTLPIRPDRKFKRPKLPKRKYHQNYKPA